MSQIEDDRKQLREEFTAMISQELDRLTGDLTASPPCLTEKDLQRVYDAARRALSENLVSFAPHCQVTSGKPRQIIKKGAVMVTIEAFHVHLEASDERP